MKKYNTILKTDMEVASFDVHFQKVEELFPNIRRLSSMTASSGQALTKAQEIIKEQKGVATSTLNYNRNHLKDEGYTPLSEVSIQTLKSVQKKSADILRTLSFATAQEREFIALEQLLEEAAAATPPEKDNPEHNITM